jgi:hypothetical protein
VPDQRTIWKRRVVVTAVVGLAIAIPVTIAVRGDGDGNTTTSSDPELPAVGEVEFDRKLGVELRLPEGWRRREDDNDGVVSFRSMEKSVLIGVSAPGPDEDADAIQAAAVDSIESEYRDVDVAQRVEGRKLGDVRAQTAVIAARHPETREPIQVLVATAKGDKLAYLVEVFAAGDNPGAALVEAQALLNNLRLKG